MSIFILQNGKEQTSVAQNDEVGVTIMTCMYIGDLDKFNLARAVWF